MITSKEFRELTGLKQSEIAKFIHSGCISSVERWGDKSGGHFLFTDVHVGQAIIAKCLLDSLGLSTSHVRDILGTLDPDALGSLAHEPKNKALKILIQRGKPLTVEILNLKRTLRQDSATIERIITPCPFTLDLLLNLDPREAYR